MTTPKVDVPNALVPCHGVCTGGQPTRESLEEARQKGFRTIVNLRPEGEFTDFDQAAVVRELGMEYIVIPVAGARDLNAENARRLHEILSDPDRCPALVHCGSGNRVGALFALRACLHEGCTPDESLQRGREAGLTGLEPTVHEILQQH
ncbi:MAG TPA: protein tyrosine phosphatase family protein [Gammaproteobacteria bacterium]|nr:protein tyrosine phosphatase family protein [Gammaproteobacteria bacterium]